MQASNSKQSSHRHFGGLNCSSLQWDPLLSSSISLSAALYVQLFQLTWSMLEHLITLTIISMALSQIHAGGTPPCVNSNDKVSCASLLDATGKALAHPKSVACPCAHLCPFWILYWQVSCLKTQYVAVDNNKDLCHLF